MNFSASIYDLYVISAWTQYSDVSMYGDTVYTSEKEAQAVLNAIDPRFKVHTTYGVQTLYDHISEVRSDAFSSGEANERDSANY